MLKAAIDRIGLSPWADIEADILYGNSLLWLCLDGERILCAGSTSLEKTEDNLVCVITACGGADLPRWVHLLEKVESYARAEGCSRVRMFGRKGWLRVLDGYSAKHVIIEKELC